MNLLEAGILPIYVFNGKYPQFKAQTIRKRRAARKEAAHKWKEAVRKKQPALKYAQGTSAVDTDILDSAQTLLNLMGVPWVRAPSEGEAQCAWMCQQGLVYATASQDLDSLLFGSPRLVRNLSAWGGKNSPEQAIVSEIDPELIELDQVLEKLGLTREQLIIVGLLIGTDYNEGIAGLGPVGAVRLMKEHQTLQKLLASVRFPGQENVQKLYEFYLNLPHIEMIAPAWQPPAVDKLRCFLVNEHDFSAERVGQTLCRLQAAFRTTSSAAPQVPSLQPSEPICRG